MRENMRMMRVLMVIIAVSNYLSFIVKPPALNFFPVDIQILPRITFNRKF